MKFLSILRPDLAVTVTMQSLSKMMNTKTQYTYVFLSPVFDSISKEGHKSHFKENRLVDKLETTSKKVFALGGCDIDKVDKVKALKEALC